MKHVGLNTVRRRRASVVLPELLSPESPNMNAPELALAIVVFFVEMARGDGWMDGWLGLAGELVLILTVVVIGFWLPNGQVGLDTIKPDDSFGCGNYWCTMCIAAISLAFNE